MALIDTITGTYDDSLIYTAHDLAADHWWIDENYLAVAVNGRVRWEHAEYRSRGGLLLWRLQGTPTLHVFLRYVDPETPMRLVKGK